jgi:formyltetrahydrofolate deformylase
VQGLTDRARAILLLSCRDQKGLVAGVADWIYRNDGNIVGADQHADPDHGVFLQRVEWDLAGFRVPREEIAERFRPIAERFGMQWSLRFSGQITRMAILVSRLGHCLFDLLWRQRAAEFAAEVLLVVSNHEDLRPVAEGLGVRYECVPVTPETRDAAEARLMALLAEERIELVVLARYMQVLGPRVLEAFPNRIINIHHSFLPAFVGARSYHQAYERGVKAIGATAHYVTAELDQGPIIEQDVARVSHRDSVDDLLRKGRDLEKVVLARAVDVHLRHGVLVYGNKTVVFD